MRLVARYLRNDRGTSAAEFALVVLPFSALVFAIIWMGLLLYSDNQLQQATEAAARCWSISNVTNANSQCLGSGPTDASKAVAYAKDRYKGLGSATFQPPTIPGSGCAHEIDGSVTININVVVYSQDVPLTARACFP